MADVQMYRFNGSSWVEINPKPAGHTHPISQVIGLQSALDGKATTSYVDEKIYLKSNTDNRGVNTVPNDYNAKFEIKGLKTNTAIGITGQGTYSALLGIRGWKDSSGGNSHEFALTGDGEIYHRHGATTTWNPWDVLAKQSWVTANTRSNTWTPTWSQVSGKPNVIIEGDSRLTNARPASDVYSWAKQPTKPTYSWTEVTDKPIISVSGTASGSGTEPMAVSQSILKEAIEAVSPPGSRPASDVYSWAKASNKPSYNLDEISETTTYKKVTQTEKDNWNNKWKLIYTGPSSLLSETSLTNITVPSDTYVGKTIAVEFRFASASGTTYQRFVAIATVGTNTTTSGSKTAPRYLTASEWDGTYLKFLSTKCFVSTTGTTSSLSFGYLKTLVGHFSGTTINWTTQETDDLSVYIGKIWVVE